MHIAQLTAISRGNAMPSKTAENVAAVQIFATLAGQEVMNDFYAQYDHQPNHSDLVDLTSAVAGVVIANFVGRLPPTWKGVSVFAFDMTVDTGANAVDDSIAGVVGVDSGVALPNNVTIAVARKNGLRGRSGNGRIFWMGLTDGNLDTENTIAASRAAALVTACEAVDAAMVDLGATPCILSYQHDGVVSSAATIYPIDKWLVTDFVLDSRRRRLPGRGR